MKTYWVLIPPIVAADHNLGDGEKVLCGIINGLTRERGYCYASNEYLAKYMGKSERSISRLLAMLEAKGYVTVRDKRSRFRKMVVTTTSLTGDIDKNGDVTTPKVATDSKRDVKRKEDVRIVFDFWVEERRKAMKFKGPAPRMSKNRKGRINARLEEGYTVDDLKEAVLGILSSKYNVKGGYTDIELACRSAQKVDQYRAWHHAGGRPTDERKPRWDDTPPEPKEWE